MLVTCCEGGYNDTLLCRHDALLRDIARIGAQEPSPHPRPQTLKTQLVASYTADLRMLDIQLETLKERRAMLLHVLRELEDLPPEVVEAIVRGGPQERLP